MPDEKICSRTGPDGVPCTNPATETHQWCKSCKATYQREYELVRQSMAISKGFLKGVDVTVRTLSWHFAQHGSRVFTGKEIAFAIENAQRPVYAGAE